jgi:mRNA interferase MazF
LLCQVTSNPYSDPHAVVLTTTDFQAGSLHVVSYARPGKLFTANQALIVAVVGRLTDEAFRRVANALIDLLRANLPL